MADARLSPKRALAALHRFLHLEAASGVILLIAAAAALLWANVPSIAQSYHALWHWSFPVGSYTTSVHFIVNDVLMTVFFLVVGMEIRREMHQGALKDARAALMPIIAALGGVVIPAAVFLFFNAGSVAQHGWAIPTATDIAFAVGVLALLGRSIPSNVRIFLLAVAIIDDIIAVLIIAFFYSGGLDYTGFAIAAIGIVLVLAMQKMRINSAWAYVLPGAVIWSGLLYSGAHPTLAGVVLGLMTPVVSYRGTKEAAPVIRVQEKLHPFVAFGIMPLFALANAGITFHRDMLATDGASHIVIGIIAALVIGKPLGIVGASWLAVTMRLGVLPRDVSWRGMILIGLVAGVGFTMSIFIALLAYSDAHLVDAAKAGVVTASGLAAIGGLLWGRIAVRGYSAA